MTHLRVDAGSRLSERVRAALARFDLVAARQLAVDGDGEARDLATEYALMVRGLNLTVHILLRQLDDLVDDLPASTRTPRPRSMDELGGALLRLLTALHGTNTAVAPDDRLIARALTGAATALDSRTNEVKDDQARRAAEIVAAIDAADPSRACDLLDEKDRAYVEFHDPTVRFMADTFDWVLRTTGPRGLLEFHLATAEAQRAGFERWELMPTAEFARQTAFLLKQHMGQVDVTEHPDRFTIHQSPCGSGGRLRLTGAYDGTDSLAFVEAPGPLTFGEGRMPVYCSHCAVWNGTATIEWFGRAQWVFEQPARPDGSCTLHVFKRREDIPAAYTARVSLRDPGESA